MPKFTMSEPFDIPVEQQTRTVDLAGFRELVQEEHAAFDKAGCFVVSTKSGRGSMPWYVGKNLTRISARITGHKQLEICNGILGRIKRGRLQVWTLTQSGRGRRSTKAMDELESTLIQAAVRKNPELINPQKPEGDNWIIEGLQTGRGRQPAKARAFRAMLAKRGWF